MMLKQETVHYSPEKMGLQFILGTIHILYEKGR